MITTSTTPDPRPRAMAWVGMPGELPLPANGDALALAAWRAARRKARQVDGPDRGDEVIARMRRRAAEDAGLRAELAELRKIVKAAGLALPEPQGRSGRRQSRRRGTAPE